MAFSHKNMKGLVAKRSPLDDYAAGSHLRGRKGKVEAPGCEVKTVEIMKDESRGPQGHVFKSGKTTVTGAVWGLGSFPVLMWGPRPSMEPWTWQSLWNHDVQSLNLAEQMPKLPGMGWVGSNKVFPPTINHFLQRTVFVCSPSNTLAAMVHFKGPF